MRAFLAIELPEDIRASLGQAVVRLRKSLGGRLTWVRGENLHITVRFLGEVPETTLDTFSESVSASTEAVQPVRLRIGGLGVYPNARRPKVLWSGAAGELEQLLPFQAQCEQAARICGLEPEKRPWSPHVTLARFRESPQKSALQSALDTFADYEAGEFLVPGVTLFSSQLTPHGAAYTSIRKFPFSCRST